MNVGESPAMGVIPFRKNNGFGEHYDSVKNSPKFHEKIISKAVAQAKMIRPNLIRSVI